MAPFPAPPAVPDLDDGHLICPHVAEAVTRPLPPRFVGFWAPAPQSGKSTAMKILMGLPGGPRYGVVSFAAAFRVIITNFLVMLGVDRRVVEDHMTDGRLKEVPIPGVGKSFVELAIFLGTDFGRNFVGADTWVRIAAENARLQREQGAQVLASDDTRFPNEADYVRSQGGVLVGIQRPGYGVSAQRAKAEGKLSLDDMDYVIVNDGTLAGLRASIIDLARELHL